MTTPATAPCNFEVAEVVQHHDVFPNGGLRHAGAVRDGVGRRKRLAGFRIETLRNDVGDLECGRGHLFVGRKTVEPLKHEPRVPRGQTFFGRSYRGTLARRARWAYCFSSVYLVMEVVM
jgi:hypothetical protein